MRTGRHEVGWQHAPTPAIVATDTHVLEIDIHIRLAGYRQLVLVACLGERTRRVLQHIELESALALARALALAS